MPLTWEIDADTGLILIAATGAVPIEAYLDLWKELMGDPRIEPGPCVVADFREVEVTRTGAEVRTVAAGTKRFNEFMHGGRMAVVATQQASFGLARMYEALIEERSIQVRVFRDAEEARTWALEGLTGG